MKESFMSEKLWWYSKEGEKIGPETVEELLKLINSDALQRNTLVWTDGMDEWLEAQHVKEFESLFKGPPPLPSDSQSKENNYDRDVHANEDKPFAFQPIRKINEEDDDVKKMMQKLAADVRKQYIATLFKVNTITGRTIGIVVGLILIFIFLVNTEFRTWFMIILPFIGYGIADDITNKIREKKYKDKSDQLIYALYDEHIKKQNTQTIISSITGSIVVIFIIGVLIFSKPAREKAINIYNNITSSTNCVLLENSAHKDTFYIKSKSDYGYTVKAKIKNDGDEGEISLLVKLITSEGNFTRKQKIQLKKNESRNLAYQFPEPTVNATNVRYELSCGP